MVLKRNDGYWLAKPNLEEVVLRPIPDQATQASNLQVGGVDVIETVNSASFQLLQSDKNVTVGDGPIGELRVRRLQPDGPAQAAERQAVPGRPSRSPSTTTRS